MISIRPVRFSETPNAVCAHCRRRGVLESAQAEAIDGHIRTFLCAFHEERARNRQFIEAWALVGPAMMRPSSGEARRILTAERWQQSDIDAVLTQQQPTSHAARSHSCPQSS